jgi:hypothetical protein
MWDLDPDPDGDLHKYDYRGAFKAGFSPDIDGHFPSKFKDDDHPNRFVKLDDGAILDSKHDRLLSPGFRSSSQDKTRVVLKKPPL